MHPGIPLDPPLEQTEVKEGRRQCHRVACLLNEAGCYKLTVIENCLPLHGRKLVIEHWSCNAGK